jgi:hypothetical protein
MEGKGSAKARGMKNFFLLLQNYDLLSFQNFWSKNAKTEKKLIKCPPCRIPSTANPNCLKNTLNEK